MVTAINKVSKIVVDAIIFAVFVVLVIIIGAKVKTMVTKTSYTELFGYSIFNVVTGSMEPTIFQNDIIVDKKEKIYKVDDIVTYEQDGEYITHRIIAISGNKIITQGDNNNTPDKDIPVSCVIGKVVKIMPNAGIWQKILTTPSVMVAIFVTLLLFDLALSYKGFDKKEKETPALVEGIVPDIPAEETKVEPKIVEQPKVRKVIKANFKGLTEDYTVRLDLTEIQKLLDKEINKEDE